MATPEKAPEKAPVPPAPTLKRVIIQRPYGVTDSHIFIGFNQFEGQFQYDVPINLPQVVVDHLRAQERVEYRPDEQGKPVAHKSRAFAVIDA